MDVNSEVTLEDPKEEKVISAEEEMSVKSSDTNENDDAVKGSEVDASESGPTISKRQRRKQEKLRHWQETKHLRKEKRKQKKKEVKQKQRQRLEIMKLDAEEKGLDPTSIIDPYSRKGLKSNSMKNSSCKIGVCIDMSFDNVMLEKNLHKCVKQVHRCYSINRRYENPLQLHISSFTGKSSEVMAKNDGWENWDVHFHDKSYLELEGYPKEKVVYLTAESENVLEELDDSKLYVIGGLVDHNSLKGLCHKLALEKGVQTARLPLDEHIEMSTRRVLTIVHVFEILGGISQKRPWAEVIMQVIPSRTQAKLKEADDDASDGD